MTKTTVPFSNLGVVTLTLPQNLDVVDETNTKETTQSMTTTKKSDALLEGTLQTQKTSDAKTTDELNGTDDSKTTKKTDSEGTTKTQGIAIHFSLIKGMC